MCERQHPVFSIPDDNHMDIPQCCVSMRCGGQLVDSLQVTGHQPRCCEAGSCQNGRDAGVSPRYYVTKSGSWVFHLSDACVKRRLPTPIVRCNEWSSIKGLWKQSDEGKVYKQVLLLYTMYTATCKLSRDHTFILKVKLNDQSFQLLQFSGTLTVLSHGEWWSNEYNHIISDIYWI